MSLLHQDSPEEIDDAALGEEFTKGSSHVVWASVIAAIVVTLIVIVVLLVSRKPPVAAGDIVQVWAFSRHGETSGIDANGDAMAKQTVDQVLLFAHLKLHNQSKVPLTLTGILANLKTEDGVPISVSAGSVAQYQEAVLAYPDIPVPQGTALAPHTILDPGQSIDGIAFWVLHMTKDQWQARRNWGPDSERDDPGSRSGLNFTFALQYQKNLIIEPKNTVTEQ